MAPIIDLCRLCAQKKKIKIDLFSTSHDLRAKIKLCLDSNISSEDLLPKVICIECQRNVEQFHGFKVKCRRAEAKLRKISSSIGKVAPITEKGSTVKNEMSERGPANPNGEQIMADHNYFTITDVTLIDEKPVFDVLPATNILERETKPHQDCNLQSPFVQLEEHSSVVDIDLRGFDRKVIEPIQNSENSIDDLDIIYEDLVNWDELIEEIPSPQIIIKKEPKKSSGVHLIVEEVNQNHEDNIEPLLYQRLSSSQLDEDAKASYQEMMDRRKQLVRVHPVSSEGKRDKTDISSSQIEKRSKYLHVHNISQQEDAVRGSYLKQLLSSLVQNNQLASETAPQTIQPNNEFQKCGEFADSELMLAPGQHVDIDMETMEATLIKKKHPNFRFKCRFCKLKSFKFYSSLLKHLKTHKNPTNKVKTWYPCNVCGETFKMLRERRGHQKLTHGVSYRCNHCPKTYNKRSDLKNHEAIHFEKRIECELCGRKFHTKKKVRSHIAGYHTESASVPCGHCDRVFRSKQHLQLHMNLQLGVKPFICSTCGARFAGKSSLWRHEMKHRPRGYACVTCGQAFFLLHQLRDHENVHRGKTPYVCNICSQGFHTSQQLYSHAKKHSMKCQECDICGRMYSRKERLKAHIIGVHNKQTPYKCTAPLCTKAYSGRSALRHHARRHITSLTDKLIPTT